MVTLVLRKKGPGLHISMNKGTGLINDIRNLLGTGKHGNLQFTGIYAVRPDFIKHLTPGKVESVIPIFLKLIAAGERIGGVIIDDGRWWDLGDRFSYLRAHKQMLVADDASPKPAGRLDFDSTALVHPDARVDATATLNGCTVVGPQAEIGAGAVLQDCILWPGARVAAGANLTRCIVLGGKVAKGELVDEDI
jgi:mannose-1-phosphate guanylyltransferase/mannose-1-phosphate guanylyltransferase/phosphomannomutase